MRATARYILSICDVHVQIEVGGELSLAAAASAEVTRHHGGEAEQKVQNGYHFDSLLGLSGDCRFVDGSGVSASRMGYCRR